MLFISINRWFQALCQESAALAAHYEKTCYLDRVELHGPTVRVGCASHL